MFEEGFEEYEVNMRYGFSIGDKQYLMSTYATKMTKTLEIKIMEWNNDKRVWKLVERCAYNDLTNLFIGWSNLKCRVQSPLWEGETKDVFC